MDGGEASLEAVLAELRALAARVEALRDEVREAILASDWYTRQANGALRRLRSEVHDLADLIAPPPASMPRRRPRRRPPPDDG